MLRLHVSSELLVHGIEICYGHHVSVWRPLAVIAVLVIEVVIPNFHRVQHVLAV